MNTKLDGLPGLVAKPYQGLKTRAQADFAVFLGLDRDGENLLSKA
jgi:hypothetical protein